MNTILSLLFSLLILACYLLKKNQKNQKIKKNQTKLKKKKFKKKFKKKIKK